MGVLYCSMFNKWKVIVYSSKFFILKADALYPFEKIQKKKFRFEEILNKVTKHHRQQLQDHKTII